MGYLSLTVNALPLATIIAVLVTTILLLVVSLWLPLYRIPSSLHWGGRRDEAFPLFRAFLRQFNAKASLNAVTSGYEQFSKRQMAFVMPEPNFQPLIVLPKEHIQWLLQQGPDVLSLTNSQHEKSGVNYLTTSIDPILDTILIKSLSTGLNKTLKNRQTDLVDEIQYLIDTTLGEDEASWKEVNLFKTMNCIAYQVAIRVLLGKSFSRDEKLIHNLLSFSKWLGLGIFLMAQCVPQPLRKIAGIFPSIPVSYYRYLCRRTLGPVLEERFQNIRRKVNDPKFIYDAPDDFFTWIASAALEKKDGSIKGSEVYHDHFIFMLGSALMTVPTAAVNICLDILSSDPNLQYYQTLRKEAEATFQTGQDWQDASVLQNLQYTDSCLRESSRRNPILVTGLWRQVVAFNGVTLPDGTHVQKGTWIAHPILSIQNDSRFYDDADAFKPFRFVSQPSSSDAVGMSTANKGETSDKNQQNTASFTMTSESYLAFSYGRHACPGRWLASNMLKTLLAYITIHYDIQPLETRPMNKMFGDLWIPPMDTNIRVKRRKVVG